MARHEIKTGRIGPNQLGTKHDGLGPGWPGPAQFPALVITKEKGASLSFFPRQREGDGRAIEVLMIDDDVITARLRSIFDDDDRPAGQRHIGQIPVKRVM